MPRELVMMLWCDFCAEQEQSEQGVEHVFTLDGSKPHALVACERHHKEVVEPFVDALNRLGIPTSDTPDVPKTAGPKKDRKAMTPQPEDPVVCVMCERVFNDRKVLKNQQTLASHRTQYHQVKAAAFRAFARGDAEVVSSDPDTGKVVLEVKPLPGKDELWDIPQEYHCGIGDCPSVFDPRDFSNGEDGAFRAVSGHRTSSHKTDAARAA